MNKEIIKGAKIVIKYKSSERKVDMYDIGDGLTLMNIIKENQDGQIQSVDTYIGAERDGFCCVGHAEGLDQPGVIFSYSKYVKLIQANLQRYLNIYYIQNV